MLLLPSRIQLLLFLLHACLWRLPWLLLFLLLFHLLQLQQLGVIERWGGGHSGGRKGCRGCSWRNSGRGGGRGGRKGRSVGSDCWGSGSRTRSSESIRD